MIGDINENIESIVKNLESRLSGEDGIQLQNNPDTTYKWAQNNNRINWCFGSILKSSLGRRH